MGQMAATAGGVAAGSVLGHGLSRMIWGGGSGGSSSEGQEAGQQQHSAQGAQGQQGNNPCAYLQEKFDQCLRSEAGNISACQWSSDQLMQCKKDYNLI
eukprot:254017_1